MNKRILELLKEVEECFKDSIFIVMNSNGEYVSIEDLDGYALFTSIKSEQDLIKKLEKYIKENS